MCSKVYFLDIQTFSGNFKLFENILLKEIKIDEKFKKNDIIGVKIHFGEKGNRAYIKPVYANWFCDFLKRKGYKPFLTDTNTLYKGMRSNSVDHLDNAFFNGFSYFPVIIADGLRGESYVKVEKELDILKEFYIGADIFYSDGLLFLTHFKGHELTGFGGSIKNMGMGCAAKRGKLVMHSNLTPSVDRDKCKGCFKCLKWCNVNSIKNVGGLAEIDKNICVGCGLCLEICDYKAINIDWEIESSIMQKKMAEYAKISVEKKPSVFVNFVMDISPVCDCYPYNKNPIAKDVGILFSDDPVALDRASFNLVCERTGYDPFKKTHPSVDSLIQLEHAEKIGLGTNEYELVQIT